MKYSAQNLFKLLRRKKKIAAIFLILLITAIYFLMPKGKEDIETITVKKGTLTQTISATGKIQSATSSELNFLTGGRLAYIGANKGDPVAKFQTIATLDTRSVQKKLESSLRDYSLQRNDFEDQQDKYDDRKPVDATSDAMRRILQNNQLDLEKAILSVELQELAKQESYLTSPIEGVLIRADVTTTGVNIPPTAKFVVADPLNLIFQLDVDEADIGKIKLGQIIELTLDAFPDNTVKVPVDLIDFASHDTSTGGTAYTVRATLPLNSDQKFRIGMNGDASIIVNEKNDIMLIPLASIIDDKYVYIKEKDKFVKKEIKLGLENDLDVEVISGLSSGDIIASQPTDIEPIKNE